MYPTDEIPVSKPSDATEVVSYTTVDLQSTPCSYSMRYTSLMDSHYTEEPDVGTQNPA